MPALYGKYYFCACSKDASCDENCAVYRAREGFKENSMIQVSEAEFEKMGKAMLLCTYMKDVMRLLEEIDDG